GSSWAALVWKGVEHPRRRGGCTSKGRSCIWANHTVRSAPYSQMSHTECGGGEMRPGGRGRGGGGSTECGGGEMRPGGGGRGGGGSTECGGGEMRPGRGRGRDRKR